MSSVTFTPRVIRILSRVYETECDFIASYYKDRKCTRDFSYHVSAADLTLNFTISPVEDDEDYLYVYEPYWITVRLCLQDNQIFDTSDSENDFTTEVKSLEGKTFSTCVDCGSISVNRKRCRRCYIYEESRENDCCICLENEEQCWVDFTGCTHSVHLKCGQSLPDIPGSKRVKKCPVCRTESTIKGPEVSKCVPMIHASGLLSPGVFYY